MADVECRCDALIAEDRYAAGGLEDIGGSIGIGDVDEHGLVEDRIEARADGTDLGVIEEPSAIDR